MLSQQIISGALPFFTELCSMPGEEPVRHDLRRLPDHPPRNQILIIECATHVARGLRVVQRFGLPREMLLFDNRQD